ncbi:hypothetical protein KZX45_00475 [Georgenia sp. EYE_87]|uniref:hypothetical protein n=1 Tax=Georgenia sp. EYE_87 TaxID=2853448 RepID=UPI002004B69F|nr:hypothetical protein [Georgenia sp. EYE_87]MCK6209018.1 hypothetical protein [Georgenia sp. EYE_87]
MRTAVGLIVAGIALAACGPAGTGARPEPPPGGTKRAGTDPTQTPATTASGSPTARGGSTTQPRGLAVRGIIGGPDGTAVELAPALAVDLAPHADDPDGTHAIVLVDGTGAVVRSTAFTPVRSSAEPAEGTTGPATSGSPFLVVVPPDLSSVAEVRLEAAGKVLATRRISSSPPAVGAPALSEGDAGSLGVTWTSSDPDRDPLTHWVLVSADGGASWESVAADLTGRSVSVSRSTLPGGTELLVRVVVSDGLRSAFATSPLSALPNNPPTVAISAPADGQRATGDQTVVLRATVVDPEDGSRDGTPVEWSSDVDGHLGTAAELLRRADHLSEGMHTITATARDSAGGVAIDQVTLHVGRS